MKQVGEPITSEPRLANFPVRMRQDIVSVYRDCGRKVMKAVDEIETACRMLLSTNTCSGKEDECTSEQD
jgi:hypothetical protein